MSSDVLKSRKTIDQQPQLDAWTPNLSILLMFDLIKKILGASRSSCPPIRFSLSLCVAIRACNMLHFHSCCMSLSLTHTVSGVVSLCGVGFSILLQAMVTLLWHSAVCPNAARTPAARTPAARLQPAAAAAAHLRKALAWLLRALNDAAEVAAEPPLLSRGGWRPLSHVASRPRSRPAVLSCDRRRI